MKSAYRIATMYQAGHAAHAATLPFFAHEKAALLLLIAFILFVLSGSKFDITLILVYAAFPLFLILAARIPLGFIIKRLLLISPFIIIMAAANPFFDRQPVIQLCSVVITSGMISGLVIIAKSMVTITAVMAFTRCIEFYKICSTLEGMGVPKVFVTQLALLYRYSFLLVNEAMAMQRARNLRSFSKHGHGIFSTAGLIGSLLIRATTRAEHSYRGMVARGFNGELSHSKSLPISGRDWALLTVAITVLIVIRMVF